MQKGDLAPLLDDEGGGESEGFGPADCKIVDRATDGDLADVAAGEFEWGHDKAVGGEGKTCAGFGKGGVEQAGLVFVPRRVEGGGEDGGNEVMHRAATAAAGEGDMGFTQWRAVYGATVDRRAPPYCQ